MLLASSPHVMLTRSLVLRENAISQSGVEMLRQWLVFWKTRGCVDLDVSHCDLPRGASETLLREIAGAGVVSTLFMSGNNFGGATPSNPRDSLASLFASLITSHRDNFQNLKMLHLRGCSISLVESVALVRALALVNHIKTLDLADNFKSSAGGSDVLLLQQLQQAVCELDAHLVDLSFNSIGEECAQGLVMAWCNFGLRSNFPSRWHGVNSVGLLMLLQSSALV